MEILEHFAIATHKYVLKCVSLHISFCDYKNKYLT